MPLPEECECAGGWVGGLRNLLGDRILLGERNLSLQLLDAAAAPFAGYTQRWGCMEPTGQLAMQHMGTLAWRFAGFPAACASCRRHARCTAVLTGPRTATNCNKSSAAPHREPVRPSPHRARCAFWSRRRWRRALPGRSAPPGWSRGSCRSAAQGAGEAAVVGWWTGTGHGAGRSTCAACRPRRWHAFNPCSAVGARGSRPGTPAAAAPQSHSRSRCHSTSSAARAAPASSPPQDVLAMLRPLCVDAAWTAHLVADQDGAKGAICLGLPVQAPPAAHVAAGGVGGGEVPVGEREVGHGDWQVNLRGAWCGGA